MLNFFYQNKISMKVMMQRKEVCNKNWHQQDNERTSLKRCVRAKHSSSSLVVDLNSEFFWTLNPRVSVALSLLPNSHPSQLNRSPILPLRFDSHTHTHTQRWWSHRLCVITSTASCRTSPAWRFSSSILKRYTTPHFSLTISHNVGKSHRNINKSIFVLHFFLFFCHVAVIITWYNCVIHIWINLL